MTTREKSNNGILYSLIKCNAFFHESNTYLETYIVNISMRSCVDGQLRECIKIPKYFKYT